MIIKKKVNSIKFIRLLYFTFIISLFILLLSSNLSVCYANNFETRLKMRYEEVETEDGIFYKEKEGAHKVYIPHSISNKVFEKENERAIETINTVLAEYMRTNFEQVSSEDKKVTECSSIDIVNVYSITEENPYNYGDEIVALATVWVKPLNSESSYWKENYSDNEFHYDMLNEEYTISMDFYLRLVFNEESKVYEIAYIDCKPENLEKEFERLKNEGIDLKNLDIKQLIEVKYEDEIKVVSNNSTEKVSANKIDYNSKKIEDVSKMTMIIRMVALVVIVFMIVCMIRSNKRKNMNK